MNAPQDLTRVPSTSPKNSHLFLTFHLCLSFISDMILQTVVYYISVSHRIFFLLHFTSGFLLDAQCSSQTAPTESSKCYSLNTRQTVFLLSREQPFVLHEEIFPVQNQEDPSVIMPKAVWTCPCSEGSDCKIGCKTASYAGYCWC